MSDNLQPYAAYKPSGVQWLGDVPVHWEVRPLRYWVRINEEVLPETTEPSCHFSYLEISAVGTGALIDEPRRIRFGDAPSRARRVVRAGDTIVSTVRTYLKAVWFADKTDEDLICSTGFAVLTPQQKTAPQFVKYLAQSNSFTDHVTAESVGIAYPAIAESKLTSFHVCFPPFLEQAAIVRYLDYVDRRIRRYVSAKERLIGLLEEEKQAVIHRAVTRGLDPNVPLKPSGVEWLGDVPAHWEVRRTKSFFRLRTEKSGVAHGRELLSIYTHIGVRPRKDLEEKGNKASSTDDYWIVKRGDLIANKLLAWMGAIGVSHYDGVTSPAYDILMPIGDLVSDYYHHLFRTRIYLQQFKQRSRGIMDMRLRLYFDQLGLIPIPVPPVDEQQAIVECLDKATADIDAAIGRTKRQSDLIQEYRTRLIADVVTGKLDVREAAAGLPVPGEDDETIDESRPLAENIHGDLLDADKAAEELAMDRGVTV